MSINNQQKLIIHKMSLNAVPPGGGINAALDFLLSPQKIQESFQESKKWVEDVISIVKNASEPNSWKKATDEEIAGEILRRIEEKKGRLK